VAVGVALTGGPPSPVSTPVSVGVAVGDVPVGVAVGDVPVGVAVGDVPVGVAVGDMPVGVAVGDVVAGVGVGDVGDVVAGVGVGLAAGEVAEAHDGDGVGVGDGARSAAVSGWAEVTEPATAAFGYPSTLVQPARRDGGQAADGAGLGDAALLDPIAPRPGVVP
jgi:hypothetical protein